MKLANKVALITGGNSGIGFATARLFVAEGARVGSTGRNPKSLQQAAKELGDNVLAIQADATDIEATERAWDSAERDQPRRDGHSGAGWAGGAGGRPEWFLRLPRWLGASRSKRSSYRDRPCRGIPCLGSGQLRQRR